MFKDFNFHTTDDTASGKLRIVNHSFRIHQPYFLSIVSRDIFFLDIDDIPSVPAAASSLCNVKLSKKFRS